MLTCSCFFRLALALSYEADGKGLRPRHLQYSVTALSHCFTSTFTMTRHGVSRGSALGRAAMCGSAFARRRLPSGQIDVIGISQAETRSFAFLGAHCFSMAMIICTDPRALTTRQSHIFHVVVLEYRVHPHLSSEHDWMIPGGTAADTYTCEQVTSLTFKDRELPHHRRGSSALASLESIRLRERSFRLSCTSVLQKTSCHSPDGARA